MPEPQGLFAFPGVSQILQGSFTLSHGISPSVATVQIVPQTGLVASTGTLSITFGGVAVQFADCLLNTATLQRGRDGLTWTLQILDRRWKWEYGEITGHYNRRNPDGTLRTDTEKTPQQLAALLLDAMGETGYNVSGLPNKPRPEANWIAETPAPLLASLVESLGCRIVYRLNNRISIERHGFGASLPVIDAMTESYGIDPPNRPDSLKLHSGPVIVESKLLTEAVGLDTDGSVKLLDDLSYKPAAGWEAEFPGSFSAVLDEHGEKQRNLARQSVWKWYRVKAQADGTFLIPGLPDAFTVSEIEQIFPLYDTLVDTYTDGDGVKRHKPAEAIGTFWDGNDTYTNSAADQLIDVDFSIDGQQGIVQFAEPVYKLGTAQETTAADVYLRTTYNVRDNTSHQVLRRTRERRLPGQQRGTGPQVVREEKLIQYFRAQYAMTGANHAIVTSIDDNIPDWQQAADNILDAEQLQYATSQTADRTYAGIIPITPDGAIWQVSWTVGPQGAETRASRNTESDRLVPTHRQRRAAERSEAAEKNLKAYEGSIKAEHGQRSRV